MTREIGAAQAELLDSVACVCAIGRLAYDPERALKVGVGRTRRPVAAIDRGIGQVETLAARIRHRQLSAHRHGAHVVLLALA